MVLFRSCNINAIVEVNAPHTNTAGSSYLGILNIFNNNKNTIAKCISMHTIKDYPHTHTHIIRIIIDKFLFSLRTVFREKCTLSPEVINLFECIQQSFTCACVCLHIWSMLRCHSVWLKIIYKYMGEAKELGFFCLVVVYLKLIFTWNSAESAAIVHVEYSRCQYNGIAVYNI